jgi:hypothetical protein
MTLGNAAGARVRLIVWCKACQRQVEPDPAEMTERYGAETAVPDWRERMACGKCRSRRVDNGGERDRAATAINKKPCLPTGLPEWPLGCGCGQREGSGHFG